MEKRANETENINTFSRTFEDAERFSERIVLSLPCQNKYCTVKCIYIHVCTCIFIYLCEFMKFSAKPHRLIYVFMHAVQQCDIKERKSRDRYGLSSSNDNVTIVN